MSNIIETDVLIVGTGIAGGIAALELARYGQKVTIITRDSDPKESNTYYAQGGIIFKGDGDSQKLLKEDLFRAGANFANPEAIEIIADDGPDLVQKLLLDDLNIPFDRRSDDEFSLVKEGSHTVSRILHFKDHTGQAIQEEITRSLAEHPNITLLTNHTAIDLLTPSHHSLDRTEIYKKRSCVGAYLLNQNDGSIRRCLAKATILATGGLGSIYLRTSNPSWARGDGLAMAYRAGARVLNCEFIQFHPTTFHHKNAPHFLISESVRGAGAVLINQNGESFMHKYAPEWKDLAPRDVVSRGINEEMMLNDETHVYLDLSSKMNGNKIKKEFPMIYKSCLEYGIDISKEPVPVVPAAHYSCGGVWVDKWGRTTLRNLYAVGEVSCTGVHGANRLASSSLLEGVVWGARTAEYIEKIREIVPRPQPDDYPAWQDLGSESPDITLISQDMTTIKNIMWNYVGLVRTTSRLARAQRELRNLEFEIENFYRASKLNDNLIGLRNAVRAGIIVTAAAWENKNSLGCHYRI